jgi:hypothetical protein
MAYNKYLKDPISAETLNTISVDLYPTERYYSPVVPYFGWYGVGIDGWITCALYPNECRPSGTCNLSRVDAKYLTKNDETGVYTIHVQ